MALDKENCTACQAGAPMITGAERDELMQQLPDWQVVPVDGVDQLQKVFKFDNFESALAFTNRVGALAEDYNHHPALLTEWGRVTVSWWTHKISGLHRNDFVLAAKTDQL